MSLRRTVISGPRTKNVFLPLVRDRLRSGLAQFKLGAHFLDLRGLLPELRRELCDCRLQFLNFAIEHGLGLAAREITGAR